MLYGVRQSANTCALGFDFPAWIECNEILGHGLTGSYGRDGDSKIVPLEQ